MRAWFTALHPLAHRLARHYEFRYHQPVGEFETAALLGAWKAACTFRSLGDSGLDEDGLPVGLFRWGNLKITGAIIESARDEMRQHGCSRSLTARFETLSLDMPWDNDGERTLGETLADDRSGVGFGQIEDHEELLVLRARLEPTEWDILTRWACNGQSQRSIGEDVYGVTESRICQILKVILDKCRRILLAMQEDVVVSEPVLTAEQREEVAEAAWVEVLTAGEVREQKRRAKNRARYAARLAREA